MVLSFCLVIAACDPEIAGPDNTSTQNNAQRPTAIINSIGLTLTYPTNKTILDGTLSRDPVGIKSYKWEIVSGQGNGNPTITHPDSSITTISGLGVGFYLVQLTVVNQKGIAGSTIQRIDVLPNQEPFAFAGDHQVVLPNAPVILSGIGTDDNMATLKLAWKQVAGPAPAKIAEPNSITTSISQLVLGTYSFELRVVDEINQTSVDTVHVAVRNPGEIEKTQVVIKNIDFACPWGCGALINNYKSYMPPGKTLLQVFVSPSGASSWDKVSRFADWTNPTALFYFIYAGDLSINSDNESKYAPRIDIKVVYF
jgi:hypothetical protein